VDYIPFLFIGILLSMLIIGLFAKNGKEEPAAVLWVVIGFVGLLAFLRGAQFVYKWTFLLLYAAMATLTYIVQFLVAFFVYKDPVSEYTGDLSELNVKVKVHYSIPVFNEPVFVKRCIASIVNAAGVAKDIAEVEIVAVDDKSDDGLTPQALDELAKVFPNVQIIHLERNGRKKNAIAAAMCGGENWRDGFNLFEQRYGRPAQKGDKDQLLKCLKEVDCNPYHADLYLHTDSDSVISPEFIVSMIKGFQTDPLLGAISGHCDVWLEEGKKPTLITRMQIAWYFTQVRVRKAAESAYGSVFCVSGPGAGFRSDAILHLLPDWVDDLFGGRIYTGATDRKLTYDVLNDGWKVKYSALAKVWTVVPSTLGELRKQWTRWKQNAWRMFMLIWQYAWKTHPVVAFLTYARLIEMVFAPFLFSYHLILLMLGDGESSFLYLTGIAVMGSLMGLAYLISHPRDVESAFLRPVLSELSASLGSILNIRSLILTLQGSLVWRETAKGKSRRGGYYRWLPFDPSFEWHFLEVIAVIVVILYIIAYFW
jgi:cellulose synthase/poly-beta-1,6-N-acetylglucosamine synthase-like glycosyltransferase